MTINLAGAQIRIGTQTEDGTGPIHLQNVINCVGDERALIDCPTGATACSSHSTDAGVICGGSIIQISLAVMIIPALIQALLVYNKYM